MQTKIMPKKVKPKLGKIREGSKQNSKDDPNILTLDEVKQRKYAIGVGVE